MAVLKAIVSLYCAGEEKPIERCKTRFKVAEENKLLSPFLKKILGNLSTRRFLRGDGNRKSDLLPIHVSRRQGPPSRLRADFVLLILTLPVKREFRYYDFRAFISFCLQYFAHSDT